MTASERIQSIGLKLPPAPKPVGSYVPAMRVGNLIVTSGQIPMRDGQLAYAGKVTENVTAEQAIECARIAALNALAAAAEVAGGVDNIRRIIRVAVFVGSSSGFTDQPKVANGASDLFVEILGDAGRHVRAAVGVAELPLNAPVEIELTVEI